MKIAAFGGAGYIGAHTVRELLDRGHQVAVFDNLSSGLRQNLQPGAEFVHGDILQPTQLSAFLQDFKPEGVVHLAAFKAAGESMLKPEKYSVNNITGSLNLLNACVASGVKYFVFSSSAATYGTPEYLPMDEKHPTHPENYYGYTKLAIEQYLEWYGKLKGMRYAALRYFNAAGYDVQGRVTGLEQKPANLLPVVMECAAGMRTSMQVFGNDYSTPDGTGVRDYIHVNDLAVGHALAFEHLQTHDSFIVNLGVSRGSSVLEVIQMAEQVSGRKVNYQIVDRRPGDPAEVVADPRMAKQLLGWEAHHSDLRTLVETTWKAYLANSVVR
ncbi:MAG TPA: UDP-glucose 4-epimerase GalE [Fibrobacteraceae bacterium]|nr:UDP-glucose 4-epimerase GalE [Fibrobacteraceae bacterium]